MDIEELKKFAKNKIEADDLTKKVRRRIKETAWEKQNQREGFSESFKPLISQFEKPEDPKKKNIFTQNQEMLKNPLALTSGIDRNQLALTEGLKANQKAITDGFSQFERLADMRELPGNVWEEIEPPKNKDLIQFEEKPPQEYENYEDELEDVAKSKDKPIDDYYDLDQRFDKEEL